MLSAEEVRGLETKLEATRGQLLRLMKPFSAPHVVSAASSSSSLRADGNFDGKQCGFC